MMHESGDLPFLFPFQFFGDWEDETIVEMVMPFFFYRLIRSFPGAGFFM
jgi:hypothetical protein